MQLAEYLIRHQLTPAMFARRLGIGSRQSIHRYLTGERFPHPDILRRIEAITHGQVTEEDFILLQIATKAESHLDTRLPWNRYPWSRMTQEEAQAIELEFAEMMAEPREDQKFSPPLRSAIQTLWPRVKIHNEKWFYLDGRPSSPRTLVRLANEIRKKAGLPPLCYPGVHPPNSSAS